MRTLRRLAWSSLLFVPAAPAALADGPERTWETVILDGKSLDGEGVKEGRISILPDGGPAGGPAVLFDDPVAKAGSFEVPLPAGVDVEDYDELRFDYFQENGVTSANVGIWGHPGGRPLRHWYSLKRLQRVGEWDDVRFDMHFDDDGPALTAGKSDLPVNRLVVNFSKSPENPAAALPGVRARVANVRLVKTPVRAVLDTRRVEYEVTDEGLFCRHPLQLTNRTDRELTAVVEIVPETLREFEAIVRETSVRLPPGETREVEICLRLSAERLARLPPGHAERGLARVTVAELPGYDVIPLRSLRPVYLLGIIPPARPEGGWLSPDRWSLSDQLEARLESSLDWTFEAPLDVAPQHSARNRCPKCSAYVTFSDLFHYSCRNPNCEDSKRAVRVATDDPLFAAHLGSYHGQNATLARDYALAYAATGDERYGNKAVEILTAYADVHGRLAKVGNIPSWDTPLASSVIFIGDIGKAFMQAYLTMEGTGLLTAPQARLVREQLLGEILHAMNQFYYGASAGQMTFVRMQVESAPAIGKWYFLADALAGDASFPIMLHRTFDVDGIAVEGGAYARIATERMVYAAESLRRIGVPVDTDRVDQIVRNARAVGFYGAGELKPSWYREGAPESVSLSNTGFTILANGAGEDLRKATINWGSQRDRGESDLLSYDLRDDRELLVKETGRIDYGSPYSFLMTSTFAHNIPVVNEQNISMERKRQDYFHSDERYACCLVSDTAETPSYPAARVSRALILFEGCLLAVDRVVAELPSTIDMVIYGFGSYGLPAAVMETSLEGMEPFTGPLGRTKPYTAPWDLNTAAGIREFEASWSRTARNGDRTTLRALFLGDETDVFTGRSRDGWEAVERTFLMVRRQGDSFLPACLYERIRRQEKPQIEAFTRLDVRQPDGTPAADGRAAGYRIELTGRRTAEILVSFDGGVHAAGGCRTDASKRIDARLTRAGRTDPELPPIPRP